MTIGERIRKCQANLARSVERLDRASGSMDGAFRDLAGQSRKFADATTDLTRVIDRLEGSLRRYGDELTDVHAGMCELGGKSRHLTSIMDDYLTGQPQRRTKRAA